MAVFTSINHLTMKFSRSDERRLFLKQTAHNSQYSFIRYRSNCIICASWKQATDPASGRPYYYNTETNETSWTAPTEQPSSSSSSLQPPQQQQQTATLSLEDSRKVLDELIDAYVNDKAGGMYFQEAARSRRNLGIFEEEYFVFLSEESERSEDNEKAAMILKVRARLSNPLLRQTSPFEMF